MKIIDIINGYWAIEPDMLTQIQEIYFRRVNKGKLTDDDIKEITHAIGKPLKRTEQGFTIQGNGVAVIPIHDSIAKKANLFMNISGGASTELIGRDLKAALKDKKVKSIVFDIDSPGGTVDGSFELADMIFKNRGKKPMVAFSDGLMASAAFLIGSSVGQVFISSNTVRVGSIGIVQGHQDISKAEDKAGIKTTIITSGKFKALGNKFEPLSEEARKEIQKELDFLMGVFISEVALFRGVSIEAVMEDMADGRIFTGSQAMEAGLVDGIISFDQLIEDMSNKKFDITNNIINREVNSMTFEDFKAENPEEAKKATKDISEKAVEASKVTIQEKVLVMENLNKENGELKGSLKTANETIKENDKKLTKIQLATNEKRADSILDVAIVKADLPKAIEDKIKASYKPSMKDHVDKNGCLEEDKYTKTVQLEVDSWKNITTIEKKQAMDHDGEVKTGEDESENKPFVHEKNYFGDGK